jgi:hypothetical protein
MKKFNLLSMKTGLAFASAALLLSLTLGSCKKERGNNNDSSVTATPESFRALTENGFRSLVQTQDFNASDGVFTYISPKGTIVRVDGACLRKNGNAVSGNVTLEFYEAYEYSDMLIANKATMGLNSASLLEPLKTGGQYYVNVVQDGVSLTSNCAVTIEASSEHTGGFDADMVGWLGYFDKQNLLWEQDSSVQVTQAQQERSYHLTVPGFGWFNCDRFYDDPRPKTNLAISMPSAYVDASNVYAVIKGEPYSLGLANYGQWPVGIELYLIFVTENNGNYQWETKEITVVNNQTVNFDLTTSTLGSMSQLETYLATLQ